MYVRNTPTDTNARGCIFFGHTRGYVPTDNTHRKQTFRSYFLTPTKMDTEYRIQFSCEHCKKGEIENYYIYNIMYYIIYIVKLFFSFSPAPYVIAHKKTVFCILYPFYRRCRWWYFGHTRGMSLRWVLSVYWRMFRESCRDIPPCMSEKNTSSIVGVGGGISDIHGGMSLRWVLSVYRSYKSLSAYILFHHVGSSCSHRANQAQMVCCQRRRLV